MARIDFALYPPGRGWAFAAISPTSAGTSSSVCRFSES
jgi:hypothetical protein